MNELDDIMEDIKDAKRHCSNLEIRIGESGISMPRPWYRALQGMQEALNNIDTKVHEFIKKHEDCSVTCREEMDRIERNEIDELRNMEYETKY